jgi:hypothetical protein
MPDSKPAPGTRIADRYVLERELGAGGMGVVYCARDERLDRQVAVKLLPASAVGDEQARKRLTREARAAAGLEHSGIVHVYDVGETGEGGAFLVMELVKGKTLRAHLEDRSLGLGRRLRALVEVGRALAFAHEKGFVHRDVKPDNVMIRDDGRAALLDFGLVKAATGSAVAEAATVTAKGTFVGTPAYMSPEQARGESVDARTDQFALAVALFEAMAGRVPWTGQLPIEILSEILQTPARRLRELRPELPQRLDDALARALSRSAEDRFATTGAFVDAVEGTLQAVEAADVAHAPTVAGAVPVRDGTSPAPPERGRNQTASVSGAVAPRPPTTTRRTPWLRASALAGATGAMLAIAIVAALAVRSGKMPAASNESGSPLARAGSVLACPPLAAQSYDFAQSDWLGAAAAHLACERAAIVLGDPARTLVPAELEGFPRAPGEGFPEQPFDTPDLRARTTKAAARADAWLDGSVDRRPDGFVVSLVLRSRGGGAVAQGEGAGPTVLDAVRSAMGPLIESGTLPAANSAWRHEWMEGTSAAGALALHDLHVVVLIENREAIARECQATHDRKDIGEAILAFATTLCAERMGDPMPPRPSAIAETPGRLATLASTVRLYSARRDADRSSLTDLSTRLKSALARERTPRSRALLASVAAEIEYALGDAEESKRLALVSVQEDPRLVDVRGTAWHRLGFTTKDSRLTVLASYVAWLPWEPFPHSNLGRVRGGPDVKEGGHRAAALAGAGYWVVNYGQTLVQTGDLVAASTLAAVSQSPSLSEHVMRAEGQLRAAFEAASSSLARIPASRAMTLEASELAVDATDLAAILERPPVHVEDYYVRFLAPDPPPFSNGVVPFFAALSTCMQAARPTAVRCVGRIAELFREGHFGAAYLGAREAIAGAERYAVGDFAGAARAWRAILSRSALTGEMLRTPMATAFDRAGETELAERVDATALQEGALPSLALERGAVRAAKRGDCETARRLAARLVAAWDAADEKPPSVERMKRLMSRCGT